MTLKLPFCNNKASRIIFSFVFSFWKLAFVNLTVMLSGIVYILLYKYE